MFLDQSIKEKEKKKKKKIDKNISVRAEVAARYIYICKYVGCGFPRAVKNSRQRKIEIEEKKERRGKGKRSRGGRTNADGGGVRNSFRSLLRRWLCDKERADYIYRMQIKVSSRDVQPDVRALVLYTLRVYDRHIQIVY